jgi:hypothetical protein
MIDASADARAFLARAKRRAHQKHRQGCLAHDRLGIAAHDHARELAPAVCPEHDEVGAPLPGLLNDQIGNRTTDCLLQHGLDRDAAFTDLGPGTLEQLFPLARNARRNASL